MGLFKKKSDPFDFRALQADFEKARKNGTLEEWSKEQSEENQQKIAAHFETMEFLAIEKEKIQAERQEIMNSGFKNASKKYEKMKEEVLNSEHSDEFKEILLNKLANSFEGIKRCYNVNDFE